MEQRPKHKAKSQPWRHWTFNILIESHGTPFRAWNTTLSSFHYISLIITTEILGESAIHKSESKLSDKNEDIAESFTF